uniref:Uncharacterized protein n=1 Tax=Glossina palpalis gambiensis TaxID=67801 RepID=A0A1B0B0T3_9MUSC
MFESRYKKFRNSSQKYYHIDHDVIEGIVVVFDQVSAKSKQSRNQGKVKKNADISHNSLVRLKTINESFYGSEGDIRNAGVQTILGRLIVEPFENEHRPFRHFCQYSLSHHNIASKIFFCDIIDDESGSNNIEEEINQIIENINNTKTYCRVIDLLVPKGGELVYKGAKTNFNTMNYINSYDFITLEYRNDSVDACLLNVHVFYSTSSCYLQASDRARLTITTQDFFRCAEKPLFY